MERFWLQCGRSTAAHGGSFLSAASRVVQLCLARQGWGSAAGSGAGSGPRPDPVSEHKGTAPARLPRASRGSLAHQSKPLQPIGELIGNFSWTSIWSYLHACNGAFWATFVLLHPAWQNGPHGFRERDVHQWVWGRSSCLSCLYSLVHKTWLGLQLHGSALIISDSVELNIP